MDSTQGLDGLFMITVGINREHNRNKRRQNIQQRKSIGVYITCSNDQRNADEDNTAD